MPVKTTQKKPSLIGNAWIQTILPNCFGTGTLKYQRERIVLPDHDFIDVDFLRHPKSSQVVVLVHGFEGSSYSNYIKSTAKFLFKNGFDIAAINLRGCSGQDNLLPCSYHSGKTEDLRHIVESINGTYKDILLMGFSLGANLVLKYLADYSSQSIIRKAVAISAPFDLHLSALKIVKSKIVNKHFLKSLKKKILVKKSSFPVQLAHIDISRLYTIIDIDEHYTAPLHGFENAVSYYKYASSLYYIEKIRTPCLVINSLDDPLLHHPHEVEEIFKKNQYTTLYLLPKGGHVGFLTHLLRTFYHHEAYDFFRDE